MHAVYEKKQNGLYETIGCPFIIYCIWRQLNDTGPALAKIPLQERCAGFSTKGKYVTNIPCKCKKRSIHTAKNNIWVTAKETWSSLGSLNCL